MNKFPKTIRAYKIFLLFIPFYIVFGVIWPTKMALINNILMSLIYTGGYFVLNNMNMLSLYVRNLLGI